MTAFDEFGIVEGGSGAGFRATFDAPIVRVAITERGTR